MTPAEAIARPCPRSAFKDERHEWVHVSGYSDYGVLYEVRRCSKCLLVFLTEKSHSTYDNRAPKHNEVILHAFFEGS
jgi:hypothetical protein